MANAQLLKSMVWVVDTVLSPPVICPELMLTQGKEASSLIVAWVTILTTKLVHLSIMSCSLKWTITKGLLCQIVINEKKDRKTKI